MMKEMALNANCEFKDISPNFSKRGKILINNLQYDLPILIFLSGFMIISVVSLGFLQIDWLKLVNRIPSLFKVVAELTKLDFAEVGVTLQAFFESIWIAILTTVYSMLAGILFGMFMARNISPFKKYAVLVSYFFTMVRAVPSLVWALLVLSCLGLGPATGIVGLSIHSTAFFARAFAQCFEEVPEPTLEALKSLGTNRIKVFFTAVLPSSLTGLIAWVALGLEHNFSSATILGMIGGGGIGYLFFAYMEGYKYGRASIAIILVFAFTYLLELNFTAVKRSLKI